MEEKVLYKYRSLQNFENFIDILVCNRLYGANYDMLNDPMECSFRNTTFTQEYLEKLRAERRKLRICSLSKVWDNYLLWSHYADGHRGVCVKLIVRKTKLWDRVDVNYLEPLPSISAGTSMDDILKQRYSVKAKYWSYEEEVRYVKKAESAQSSYLPIIPVAVYLGLQISSKHKTLIRHVVDSLNANRKNKIQLIEMTYDKMKSF